MMKHNRVVVPPDRSLLRRDITTKLNIATTGRFTRNCVLSGKMVDDFDFPLYILTPGIVQRSKFPNVPSELTGSFTASTGTPDNVFPIGNDMASNTTTYWEGGVDSWIAYSHTMRPTRISGYTFITTNGFTPSEWRVQGSNDGTSWTDLDTQSKTDWADGRILYNGTIMGGNSFTSHRLVVDANSSSTTRIFCLQFWDSRCPSRDKVYVDASAEHPLQLAFADGYNGDGTPKDIVVTITEPVEIAAAMPPTALTYVNQLFATYDPVGESVSFEFDAEEWNQGWVNPAKLGNGVSITTAAGSPSNIPRAFDDDEATSMSMPNNSAAIRISLGDPLYVGACRVLCAASSAKSYVGLKMRHSTDFGANWTGWTTVYINNNAKLWRSYSVNNFVTNIELGSLTYDVSYISYVYAFYMETVASNHLRHRKFSGGVQYKLNFDTTVWEPVYRIPLAQFEISLNEDGTGPAFEHPNYAWVPQMGLEPAQRRIIY